MCNKGGGKGCIKMLEGYALGKWLLVRPRKNCENTIETVRFQVLMVASMKFSLLGCIAM
jgi:hypothetical protein